MRINKYIASSGFCSRRKAEEYIENGEVTVNGVLATIQTSIEEGDEVRVNGKIVEPKKDHVVLLFNKPVGITCTTELHVKGNIINYINYPERIFPIGRLDKDSDGLILLTNDGDIVNEILRAENNHEKEYIVKVNKEITDSFIQDMGKGVYLKELERTTRECEVEKIGKFTFRIILTQGLNRQIRRMCQEFGYQVVSLKRIRINGIELGKLTPGQTRPVEGTELKALYQSVGM